MEWKRSKRKNASGRCGVYIDFYVLMVMEKQSRGRGDRGGMGRKEGWFVVVLGLGSTFCSRAYRSPSPEPTSAMQRKMLLF